MKALILLWNSIFYVCLVFIKGIKTNIPWEYKIPTKVISVNRGKKMRSCITVIYWSHTSQASYISTLFVFQKCWKSKWLLPAPVASPEPALGWLGWVNTGPSCSKLLQMSNIQKYFYSHSSLSVTKFLQTTENRQVSHKNVTLSMLNALFGKHTNTNRVESFKTTALKQKQWDKVIDSSPSEN